MSYFKDIDFKNQVLKMYNRPSQMMGYVDSLYRNFLEPNGLGEIISDLPTAFAIDRKKVINRLSKLYSLLVEVEKKERVDPGSFYFYGKSINSFHAWLDVFKLYIDFLKKQPKSVAVVGVIPWMEQWDKTLNLLASQIYVIDGTRALINSFGSKTRFIQEALKHSIFMNPIDVAPRFIIVSSGFYSQKPLYARKSEDKNIQTIKKDPNRVFHYDDLLGNPCTMNIIKDGDNNTEVKKQINSYYHHKVSAGASSHIINYKISHIWQNAYDPRYFTNFWNIVLVPSWANDLLDKTKFSNLFVLQLINTYKAICEKFYNMGTLNWSSIQMVKPGYDSRFVVHGVYDILFFDKAGSRVVIAPTTVTI